MPKNNLKIGGNRIVDLRNPDGTFKKGTQIGRMKKKGYSLTDLTKVAMEYDKTHDLAILEHYIEQLFVGNRLLDKFIDRYVPPKQELEVSIPKVIKEVVFVDKPPDRKENIGENEHRKEKGQANA